MSLISRAILKDHLFAITLYSSSKIRHPKRIACHKTHWFGDGMSLKASKFMSMYPSHVGHEVVLMPAL